MKEKILEILRSEDIEALNAILAEVDELQFNDCHLTGNQVLLLAEALKSNNTLRELYLGANLIGDAGGEAIGEALKSNNTLTKLVLYNSQIGAKGGEAIAESLKLNSTLRELYLGSNQLGDKGSEAIAESLKLNSTLAELSLYNNQLGDSRRAVIVEILKSNQSLKKIDLSLEQIGDKVDEDINEIIARNKKLAEYRPELDKVQTTLLGTITNGNMAEAPRELLHKYQYLGKSITALYFGLQVKNDEIEVYINKNYLKLIGVCKSIDENHPLSIVEIKYVVLSYLEPYSLQPELLPCVELTGEEEIVEQIN